MNEGGIQNTIRMFLSNIGVLNWRNNTGQAWVGNAKKLPNGDVLIKNARPFRAGLCKGSSDIIGLTPVFITPDMLGKTIGVFTSIEVKTKTGRVTEEQQLFINTIKINGGFAGIARSTDDVDKIIHRYDGL